MSTTDTTDTAVTQFGLKVAPVPLAVERVIPPEPPYHQGTYEVGLQLSRALTVHERQALPRMLRGVHTAASVLTVRDTTLERVAAQAGELANLVRKLELEGRRLEKEAQAREQVFLATGQKEQRRLVELADSIRFRDV